MHKKSKLKNGLRVVSQSFRGVQSASLGIWINTGGRFETVQYKGISHYLEHLLFKGSKKYSCRKIKESIEGVGGSLNGFTSEELTCYLVKIPCQYLEKALDILSDIVIKPCLKKEDIEKERTVILEELKMYRDLPQSYVYELLDELLWPGQPLGAPIIGTTDSVNRISRSILQDYQENYYTASNIVISAAGQLDHDRLVKRASALFSAQKTVKLNTFVPVKESQAKPQLKIFYKDTEQTHMALGFHSFKRDHPLKYAQWILYIVLGANMSSRLFNEVREKRGMAYEIGAALKRFSDTGAFLIHAGIDNSKVEDALSLIFKELNRVRKTLLGRDEFRRAKEFLLGQLALSLEDTMEYMLWLGESTACLDKTYTLEQVVEEVNKVSLEDVRQVARQVFRDNAINLALIGPLSPDRNIYDKLCLT
ncbi:MAG: pitrilysin family protein [Candidatus Omnitrophica bacterium]|nr:pitrilysin family protein [Candidatus Omnitrophota bacterium]